MIHMNAKNPDFIMLTESWINAHDRKNSEVSLNDYNVFVKCQLHKNGGSVLYEKKIV